MKRLLLLFSLLLFMGSLSAQKRVVVREREGNTLKVTKIIPLWDSKHDFRVGVGSGSLVTCLFWRVITLLE